MKYKYLSGWVTENAKANYVFKQIDQFEDQIKLVFRKQKRFLQINLASEESFCFWSENRLLPWKQSTSFPVISNHLSSARLTSISISDTDRIIYLNFEKIDIYNQMQYYSLLIELIPRYQNIILIDRKKQIIDCKKKISFAENRHRQILQGVQYHSPDVEYENLVEEINYPIDNDKKQIVEAAIQGFDTINPLLEKIYYQEIFEVRNEQKRARAIAAVSKQIKKKTKKIDKLKAELNDAEKEQEWKQYAELLKGHYNQLKAGMDKINVVDYYQDGFPEVEIKLFKEYSVQKNIDWYFKKYRKARDGKIAISEQISKTYDEIDLLEKDIFELEEQEIFTSAKNNHKPKQSGKRSFKKITIDADWEIFIGRTSTENDLLTTKISKSNDWWFHTRIFRGTHIILRNYKRQELPDQLKLICCRLAAYYSKAKKSTNVPVDYTQIRYVRKPRGSVAGYVTYKNQKTLYVDPLSMREAVQKLENWRKI